MLRLAAACALALAFAVPGAALAEDAPYVEWANHLPALPGQFTPNTFDDCADADPACVQATLDEMYRRYGALIAAECDHTPDIAITYTPPTEIYAENARNGFFEEEDFLAREDAVFARLYFEGYDAWAAGDPRVPPAWQAAFDTGRDRAVPALGNILQGINAHVNRDMPFMLAGLGLTKPDGTSRKRDHDAMNELLNRVYDDVIAEMTARFDPSVDDFDQPGTTFDNLAIFQILPLWREAVWRNAELLTLATTPEARAGVAQWIELYALLQAQMIRAGFEYRGDRSSAQRDTHCAAQDNSVENARPVPG